MMPGISFELERFIAYALLVAGFLLLLLNHITVVSGDPWLIPTFLRIS